ncbi:MAG: hypothetical protein PUE58_01830 [Lachnospiraceae bacterium]|nr:hypothetical protein [Lachnospiraceae bacterium]
MMNEEKKEAEKESTITLYDLVEGVEIEICDRYCKFPDQYGDSPEEYDEMLENECSRCTMNRF